MKEIVMEKKEKRKSVVGKKKKRAERIIENKGRRFKTEEKQERDWKGKKE